MKKVFLGLMIIFAGFATHAQDEILFEHVEAFKKAVLQFELSQEAYQHELGRFIDPREDIQQVCADFQMNWQHNAERNSVLIETKTEKIIYNRKGDKAKVFIEDVWRAADGGYIAYLTKSNWVLLKGKWFRLNEPMEIIQSKRIKMNAEELLAM